MQSLTPNDQAKFQELIKRAEARRVEIAEEKRLEEEEAAKKRK
jgi:TRAP-type C4-dicarboxylate transport system substrate-binding protein